MADDFQYRPPAVSLEQVAAEGQQRGAVSVRVDPVQQAVDNYLLMERKARAWDRWREMVGERSEHIAWEGIPLADLLDKLLQRSG